MGAEGNPSSRGSVPMTQWVSDRTLTHFVELRLKYCIPPTIVLRLLEYKERVVCSRRGRDSLFRRGYAGGCLIPAEKGYETAAIVVLAVSSSTTPNSWLLALGFFGLWEKLFSEERPFAWQEFARLQATNE
ncbi:hypothetical protein CJ030_MR8G020273 [Morella rubra]|uniref:Uncharacterized protein n=1 Tax=Morella rubra TaxID=262757 RepID=A0A6A1UQX9_9ROSI|nr:hypothetical protein CJ030_MR8G020273 [Morella rubra]